MYKRQHLGSFEALHAAGKSFPGMRVTMVMYPDNARKIHSVLQAVAPDFKLAIIPIGNARSTLAIRDALDDGCLVGLLGDRMLGGDAARAGVVAVPFLGVPAPFSDGPLRPVSYTHLDVYKRQPVRSGRRWANCASRPNARPAAKNASSWPAAMSPYPHR